jgi:hypothetical protein
MEASSLLNRVNIVYMMGSVSFQCREMGLWTIIEGFLLLANALAILNEDRFLAPKGYGFSDFSGGSKKSFKGQIIGLDSGLYMLLSTLEFLSFFSIPSAFLLSWCLDNAICIT